MLRLTLDVEVGRFAAELASRGIDPATKVHVMVEVPGTPAHPMAAAAQAGGAFDFLADEPDLYSDDDLSDRGK